jgi:hypothetical protein
MDASYPEYARAFDIMFDPDATAEERAEAGRIMASIPPEKTREADYVWLPFRFEGEMAFLDWRDEWRIEEFE